MCVLVHTCTHKTNACAAVLLHVHVAVSSDVELVLAPYVLGRLPHYAARTTLFHCEALKSKRLYGEAAVQFIKMTSEVRGRGRGRG